MVAVLPAEYGIDPTRIGRLLGLTEMGQIKRQLAAEAAEAAQAQVAALEGPPDAPTPEIAAQPVVDQELLALEVQRAVAAALAERTEEPGVTAPLPELVAAPAPNAAGRSDELTITLAPARAPR